MLETTPVLIGAGQFTYRGEPGASPPPLELIKIAANAAAEDAGLPATALRELDGIGVVAFAIDAEGALARLPIPRMNNPPASLAQALKASPRWSVYTHMGGNASQHLINTAAERIAEGENDFVLAVGAEFLGSLMRRMAQGLPFEGWADDAPEKPQRIGDGRAGVTEHEGAHGLGLPVNMYPMFENAIRAHEGRTLAEHQARLGKLFAPFTQVAAANPYAWFPKARTAEEIATLAPDNRMIAYPYPKYMNAIMQVDQSAGVLLCSVKKARELGVPPEKWVFLHGCADAHDLWFPLERQNYYSSPAMRLTGQRALEMAGITTGDLSYIDLYSCFPSAVQVGATELGLDLDDPRRFTVTGGLPYFGGPGNNYSMHSVATMVELLRADPGSFGLATANGWFLTKQSVGVYSTKPFEGAWKREDPKVIQRQINALPHPEATETPDGPGAVETYTVVHTRDGYRMGIVIGRDGDGRRFVANTPSDAAFLAEFESAEQVGRPGTVRRADDGVHNLFTPSPA